MTYTNVHEVAQDAPLSMLGIQLHMLLGEGYTLIWAAARPIRPRPRTSPKPPQPSLPF